MTELQQLLALLVLLGIFGILGYRRGAVRELFVTLGLVFATAVNDGLGPNLVRFINQMWFGVSFVARGGLTVPDPGAVFVELRAADPLVTQEGESFVVFLLFLGGIGLGYLAGKLFASARPSLGGAILGLINGYILSALLLPLLPDALPLPLFRPVDEEVATATDEILDATTTSLQLLSDLVDGDWHVYIVALAAVIILFAVRQLRLR